MEIQQTLKDCENALRDFMAVTLEKQHGEDWINFCQATPEQIKEWEKRKQEDNERHQATTSDEHLINYTDINELKTILLANWEGEFMDTFGDYKLMETYLNILNRYRNPDIHRRPLLTFQKHLILGISGEIRNMIAVYRSYKELDREGFPRIESVRDNLGNVWTPGNPSHLKTGMTVHVGDMIEFVVTAVDPLEEDMMYSVQERGWSPGNVLTSVIEPRHVGKKTAINIFIRSDRKFHAFPNGYDDRVAFHYQVLP
jgi:hypothetical protein